MPGGVSEGLMAVKSDLRRVGEVFSSEGYKALGSIFVMGCPLLHFYIFSLLFNDSAAILYSKVGCIDKSFANLFWVILWDKKHYSGEQSTH